ncbi:MAG: hypothetical protein HYY83_03220, partial [Deltaproteobacteria bacterium]|nr:hypothetical protein [Deltaproteobacteria bacterium]
YAPATLLAYYHSDTERDFLLNTLRIYANLVPSYTGWSDYYRYQLIRGYLGDQGAIAGMDTVARFSNHQSDKLDAIRLLATLGRFDYFGTLQSAVGGKKYLRWLTMDALSLYGQSTLYRDPTRLLLESFIDSAQDHVDISMAVEAMARFDSIRAKDLLKQKYRNSLGSTRHSHFLHLFKFERDSLPEFSIESIMIEPDHFKRELYVPFYADITAGGWSKRYVEPRFVNFVKDWLVQDTSVFVKAQIRRFLEDFIPE